jgi:hypothetical protein
MDWLAGQLIQICYEMTKEGCLHNLDSLKKELSNKNPAKKSTNTRKIKFWQAPHA